MIPEKVFHHEALLEKRKKLEEKKKILKEKAEGNTNISCHSKCKYYINKNNKKSYFKKISWSLMINKC